MSVTFADVLEDLGADAPNLARLIMSRFREASPDYSGLPDEELLPGIESNVISALEIVGGNRTSSEEERSQTAALAAARARQGVGVDALMVAYRMGVEVAWQEFRERAEAMGLPAEDQLAGSERLRLWADEHMIVIARAHRQVDIELNRQNRERMTSFLQALTGGKIEAPRLRREALIHGLDPAREYLVARARGDLDSWKLESFLDPEGTGLVAHIDGDMTAVLTEPPGEIAEVITGVGPKVPLSELSTSYVAATRAVEVAESLGQTGQSRLEDFGLRASVVEQPALGRQLAHRYLDPVRAKGQFGNELIETIKVWLASGSSPEAASKALFIHRNSLRHRLRRFEELTDSNLRDPQTTAEIWWAIQWDSLESRTSN